MRKTIDYIRVFIIAHIRFLLAWVMITAFSSSLTAFSMSMAFPSDWYNVSTMTTPFGNDIELPLLSIALPGLLTITNSSSIKLTVSGMNENVYNLFSMDGTNVRKKARSVVCELTPQLTPTSCSHKVGSVEIAPGQSLGFGHQDFVNATDPVDTTKPFHRVTSPRPQFYGQSIDDRIGREFHSPLYVEHNGRNTWVKISYTKDIVTFSDYGYWALLSPPTGKLCIDALQSDFNLIGNIIPTYLAASVPSVKYESVITAGDWNFWLQNTSKSYVAVVITQGTAKYTGLLPPGIGVPGGLMARFGIPSVDGTMYTGTYQQYLENKQKNLPPETGFCSRSLRSLAVPGQGVGLLFDSNLNISFLRSMY